MYPFFMFEWETAFLGDWPGAEDNLTIPSAPEGTIRDQSGRYERDRRRARGTSRGRLDVVVTERANFSAAPKLSGDLDTGATPPDPLAFDDLLAPVFSLP